MKITPFHYLMQLQAMQQFSFSNIQPNSNYTSSFSQILQEALHMDNNLNHTKDVLSHTPSSDLPMGASSASRPISNTTAGNEQIMEMIHETASQFGIDTNLVKAVVETESNYDINAVSQVGAQGLMQLMPETAQSLGVQNPFNAKENIRGGVQYLKQMLDKYDGNKSLALAAYNAGPGNVDQYGGIPPFQETQQYVKKVLGAYIG
ncbi:lytic transglycosylase domain-containing protein [Gracilibacillus sp. YIM 98692]|uniref:lytic transglycosylase domain-containing protein n=1 Tax=Gracilibacillus sp. YIM 98692 TaxID=2663532 RepID=UPI0013D45F10|nr:lytic transglycosylase domain-containing protein [Gracilibacillus sp. YIM 98692]